MSYEHRSKVNNRIMPFQIKVILIVLAVFVILQLIFPTILPKTLAIVASPFWGGGEINSFDVESIQTEYKNALINELELENSELKEILHRSASSTKMVLANIVKKPPFTAYDSYIINVKDLNVQVGNKIYVLGNVLVGEIMEINKPFAKVKLYSSFGEKYEVFIGKSNIQAMATGRGGGAFDVILPKESNVRVDDVVIIPSLSPSIFGLVKSINIEAARAFSTVLFSQPVNIYEQKWVLIDNNN